MINRLGKENVKKMIGSYPVVVLLGPRGSGKKTIANGFSKKCFNIENDDEVYRLDYLWEDQIEKDELIVLNEISHSPELFLRIRGVLDEHRPRGGRFLITESFESSMIKILGSRVGILQLSPLLIQEIKPEEYDHLWFSGGYPHQWSDKATFPEKQWEYLHQMIERYLPNLGFQLPPRETMRLFKMLVNFHGTIYNASRIGKNLGVSYHTVNKYVDFLIRSGLVRHLPAAQIKSRKRLVKHPKLFWRDSGLLHALNGMKNNEDLFSQIWVGASWEGWVIEQICTRLQMNGKSIQAYHFSTTDGYALDLLLNYEDQLWAINTTISSNPPPEFFSELAKVASMVGADNAILISRTHQPLQQSGVVSLSLVEALLLMLDKK